ncbi:GNAT family N-acetyltransferase [Tuberibacillus sp. Marseille-P3662]|uniref:GNAT family N-acetyltransferase n=1 Tax=Tuberibacillus sp. Marseille-P3662 TaxID=1965358 RepID=UPI000A1CB80B|nr:GNAT family N-acetyltransferase [Tuberibacillus sp. Marseille-P3662]
MLIRYKRTYEKIAMGLLSFVPSEKDLKQLQSTMKLYEENEAWQLFLWKEEDIIGILGVKVDDETETAELHHVSVSPSHRGQGIGRKMVCALQELFAERYHVAPTKQTEDFYDKCETENQVEDY